MVKVIGDSGMFQAERVLLINNTSPSSATEY